MFEKQQVLFPKFKLPERYLFLLEVDVPFVKGLCVRVFVFPGGPLRGSSVRTLGMICESF